MAVGSQPQILANDFARQWQQIRRNAIDAVERVGRSGWLVLGDEVREFERQFATWWGVEHVVGVASGLDALEIALRCLHLPADTRVLTTPVTAFATTLAIVRAGLVPVWCDVDDSGGLDLDQAESALRSDRSIRAIMPVHLYGHPIDPDGMERLVKDYEVLLVEDCAQSAGAERGGRPTGTAGIAAGTSFYPTKNLGALGDGGALLTNDPGVADKARCLRDYGQRAKYEHDELGLNSRLDELHAAVLRSALLPQLDGWLMRRQAIATRYIDALDGSCLRAVVPNGGRSANHLFPVEVRDDSPAAIAKRLTQLGVTVGRHYPVICPEQPAASGIGMTVGSIPVAKRLAEREISLPIHPYLNDAEVDAVIHACSEVAR